MVENMQQQPEPEQEAEQEGAPMTPALWDDPGTDGFVYERRHGDDPATLRISRSGREAHWLR
jgi:hypothetical protein